MRKGVLMRLVHMVFDGGLVPIYDWSNDEIIVDEKMVCCDFIDGEDNKPLFVEDMS